jgi:hypothetical protein
MTAGAAGCFSVGCTRRNGARIPANVLNINVATMVAIGCLQSVEVNERFDYIERKAMPISYTI